MTVAFIALVALFVSVSINHHRSYRMSAALDRLTAAVQANASATSQLVTAYQAAHGAEDAAINAVAAQIEQETVDINNVLNPPLAP